MFYPHIWLIQVGLQNDRLDGSIIGVTDMSQPLFEVNGDINYGIHILLWLKEIILWFTELIFVFCSTRICCNNLLRHCV